MNMQSEFTAHVTDHLSANAKCLTYCMLLRWPGPGAPIHEEGMIPISHKEVTSNKLQNKYFQIRKTGKRTC